MTNQPTWKCKANLGDTHPWDYGGALVMEDTTGVYCPELWLFEVPDNEEEPTVESRIQLERCTFQGSFISDNKFHPGVAAWFGTQERLSSMAEDSGISVLELINSFCSDDIVLRAAAYKIAADYHGLIEFDQYPLSFCTPGEKKALKKRMRGWINEAHLKGEKP